MIDTKSHKCTCLQIQWNEILFITLSSLRHSSLKEREGGEGRYMRGKKPFSRSRSFPSQILLPQPKRHTVDQYLSFPLSPYSSLYPLSLSSHQSINPQPQPTLTRQDCPNPNSASVSKSDSNSTSIELLCINRDHNPREEATHTASARNCLSPKSIGYVRAYWLWIFFFGLLVEVGSVWRL